MKKLFILFVISILSLSIYAQGVKELTLLAIDDTKEHTLQSIIGMDKAFIVFVDNDCPYVAIYTERIAELAEMASSKGMRVLFVNPHQEKIASKNSIEQMKNFKRQTGWKGRYFSDPKQQLSQQLGANKLPEVFIVSLANDQLTVLFKGPIDDNPQNVDQVLNHFAKEAIQQISVKGKVSNTHKTLTMGCHIRRF